MGAGDRVVLLNPSSFVGVDVCKRSLMCYSIVLEELVETHSESAHCSESFEKDGTKEEVPRRVSDIGLEGYFGY